MEIFSGNILVGSMKRGNRTTKGRDVDTGGRMDVSSRKKSGGGQGGNPNAVMKPNNTVKI